MSQFPPPPPPPAPAMPPPPASRSFAQKVMAWAKAHPIWAVVVALVLLGAVASPFTSESTPAEKPKASQTKKADPKPKATTAPKATRAPEPATPIEKIKAALKKTDVDIENVIYERKKPRVEFNVGDNLTNGMIRTGIGNDVFAIAEAVHKSGVPVRELAIRGLFPLTDKYGKTEPGQVFFVTLLGPDLAKINYDDVVATSFDNIKNLSADGLVMVHPDLRE